MDNTAVAQVDKRYIRKNKFERFIFILSFTIIPVVMFAIFYVYVNLSSFTMAFYVREGNNIRWTFENFTRFFSEFTGNDGELLKAFGNTFKTFGINLIMFPISFAISYFLYKKIWGYGIFKVVFFIPGILSSVVVAAVYREVVSSYEFESFLQRLLNLDYLPEPLAQEEFANTFIWIHMIWLAFPSGMILYCGTLSRIPDSVVEYGKLDGVGWLREIFEIVIPMIWPTFSLMLVLQFTTVFNAGGAVFLFSQGKYGTNTFGNWCFMQVYNTRSQASNAYNYLSAVGFCVTVVACTISLTIRWAVNKFFGDVSY